MDWWMHFHKGKLWFLKGLSFFLEKSVFGDFCSAVTMANHVYDGCHVR